MDLRKLFHPPEADTELEYGSSELETSVRAEYKRHVLDQLARFGVPAEVVSVDMRAGGSVEGKAVYLAMVRLIAWQHKPCVRLLLGLPLIEINVRKAVGSSWLSEVTHFGGLWLHPSSQLHGSGAVPAILELLIDFEHRRGEATETVPSVGEGQAWRSWPPGVTDLSPLGDDPQPKR